MVQTMDISLVAGAGPRQYVTNQGASHRCSLSLQEINRKTSARFVVFSGNRFRAYTGP